jgi:hypothetical protein
MKAISLYQPWASWIAEGIKTVETRKHDRFEVLVGQRIAIHAGKRIDRMAWALATKVVPDSVREKAFQVISQPLVHGAIICTAYVSKFSWIHWVGSDLSRVEGMALIDCFDTFRSGLWLEDIHKLNIPILCKGHQGIFNVEVPE